MQFAERESRFARFDKLELAICIRLNAMSKSQLVNDFFRTVSRLGDGVFWYVLLVIMPMAWGVQGLAQSLHIGLTALVGVALYKYLKSRWVRERPFVSSELVECKTRPLDRYSFPSGHTLHAVCFSIMMVSYVPGLFWLVVPFAVAVAISRVILGLHYPSDVFVGAILGTFLAITSLSIFAPLVG